MYFLVEHVQRQICLFRNWWTGLLVSKHEPPCLTDTDNMNISYWFCIDIHQHCFNLAGSLWNASWVVCLHLKPCGSSRRPSVQSRRGDERPVWRAHSERHCQVWKMTLLRLYRYHGSCQRGWKTPPAFMILCHSQLGLYMRESWWENQTESRVLSLLLD